MTGGRAGVLDVPIGQRRARTQNIPRRRRPASPERRLSHLALLTTADQNMPPRTSLWLNVAEGAE
jgi:hypothetical protein